MTQFIILFGALTCLTGLTLLIYPESVFERLQKNYAKIESHIIAVVIRLILGALLIYTSDVSRYPLTITVIGWLSIVAAAVFAVMGRDKFCSLMVWALSQAKLYSRYGGVAATVFGAFLVHAFY